MDDKTLMQKLQKYPYLRARLEAMLSVVENTSGQFEVADQIM